MSSRRSIRPLPRGRNVGGNTVTVAALYPIGARSAKHLAHGVAMHGSTFIGNCGRLRRKSAPDDNVLETDEG